MARLKVLLVGAGGMGKTWAKNLRDFDEVETAGWIDIRAGTAGEAIETLQLKGVTPFDDLGKALSEIRPDFMVDVTIPESHREVTLAALQAGIPVLGEKPMADSMAAAREMVAAAERAGKLYMVSQSRRYDARALAFGEAIREHAGRSESFAAIFFSARISAGFARKCIARCCWTWRFTLSTAPGRSAAAIRLRSIAGSPTPHGAGSRAMPARPPFSK